MQWSVASRCRHSFVIGVEVVVLLGALLVAAGVNKRYNVRRNPQQ
jgi:hypothetical protein